MFEYAFGMMEEGALIRAAVTACMEAGIVTEDIADSAKAYKTTEVGEWIGKLYLEITTDISKHKNGIQSELDAIFLFC